MLSKQNIVVQPFDLYSLMNKHCPPKSPAEFFAYVMSTKKRVKKNNI